MYKYKLDSSSVFWLFQAFLRALLLTAYYKVLNKTCNELNGVKYDSSPLLNSCLERNLLIIVCEGVPNWGSYPGEGIRRSSPHTWASQGSCPRWPRRRTSETWGCPPASCRSGDQSSPWAQQTCKRCGQCGSPALGHSQRWSGRDGSGWSPVFNTHTKYILSENKEV